MSEITMETQLEHALSKCKIEWAPDPRMTVFDVTAEDSETGVYLTGKVLTNELKGRVITAVEEVTATPIVATDIDVLAEKGRSRTVTVSVEPIRKSPNKDAEQVTQVLYGSTLEVFDDHGSWCRVRTPDGYVAWIESTAFCKEEDIDPNAVIIEGVIESPDSKPLYAGTECKVVDHSGSQNDTVRVRFRTTEERSLPTDSVLEIPDQVTGSDIAKAARRYLGTEYEWGGMTVAGIDCSGLTWMAYHQNGFQLPRDADLQRQMGEEVARDELAIGDLLFFPGHIALSLGGSEFIHAYGDANEVVIASLDEEDDHYNETLDQDFKLAKRLC